MFHRKPIPSLGELRIVWNLSNLGACIGLCVRQRLLNKIRIKTKRAAGDVEQPEISRNSIWKMVHEVTRKLTGQSQETRDALSPS